MALEGESSTFFTAGVTGKNSAGGAAVEGRTNTAPTQVGFAAAGVVGINEGAGSGVLGVNTSSPASGIGVDGKGRVGVSGSSQHPEGSGVLGSGSFGAPGVQGTGIAGSPAGRFVGDVVVTGDLILEGADYAELLTVADAPILPGMVVVLDDRGRIRPCTQEYDTRVAGIVSGAGGVKPALVLDRHSDGAQVAVAGKLWTLADATSGAIRCGDLLTTSSTPGHARRVTARDRALGAVVGKALTELLDGVGLVRVLVSAA